MAVKKIPMRMCCGCGEMKPKKELIRVVRTSENEVKLDFTGRLNGRGAYICPDKSCLAKARKSKRIERAFECRISDELYEAFENEL
ncbi:MAG: YlxR family protein [Oscillospiraceae bacterium]|nr:YlxR family protein [Ruminococcus sp.]MBP1565637.1 YlxR family protein [Oscillospiraceae bacterium]MBQ9982863.1 YlxR family protein [Oscillospiraceae bacterium]MBR6599308.1 YlxR family protein [Oscillospiraceae bacterium]